MAATSASFPKFKDVPTELRQTIWEIAAPLNPNTTNVIVVHFTQTAYHQLSTKGNTRTPQLDYMFKLYSPSGQYGPPAPITDTKEAYDEYVRRNPNELRLNDGQRIRFNASRDTIFMSRESLYALGQYLQRRDASAIQRGLTGFGEIQTLGTPLPHHVREGFVSKKAYGLNRHALSGVTNFVTINNIPGMPNEGLARNDLINMLDAQLRDLLALRKWTPMQVDGIWDVRGEIARGVDRFFGAPDLEERWEELEDEEGLEEARVSGLEG